MNNAQPQPYSRMRASEAFNLLSLGLALITQESTIEELGKLMIFFDESLSTVGQSTVLGPLPKKEVGIDRNQKRTMISEEAFPLYRAVSPT